MCLFKLVSLFCVIVTSSSRSVSIGDDMSISRDNVTDLIKQINLDLDFDSGEFSEFLRCSTCLIECVQIQEQESYFLCKRCLKSCVNQTDAFMHFFSSHQCDVISRKTTDAPAPKQTQSVSKPKSGTGVEYLDDYMDKKYFSDKCDVTKQQFEDMKQDLSTCKTQLGNCRSGWQTDSEYDYPENPPHTQYPTDPDSNEDSPDKERSADPPTTSQTTTFEAFEQFETTLGELAELFRKDLTNGTDAFDDEIEMRNFTNEEIAAIVKKFKSMFVTKQQYEQLMSFAWGKGEIHLKSGYPEHNSNSEKKAACVTRHKVSAPVKAIHRSGRFSVQVLQTDDFRQPFIYAECASKIPSFDKLGDAECRTVPIQRTAVIVVDEKNIYDSKNCVRSGEKYICREWIDVAGACSLYLRPQDF